MLYTDVDPLNIDVWHCGYMAESMLPLPQTTPPHPQNSPMGMFAACNITVWTCLQLCNIGHTVLMHAAMQHWPDSDVSFASSDDAMILRSCLHFDHSRTADFCVVWPLDSYVGCKLVFLTEAVALWALVASCLSLWRRMSGFGLTLHGGLPALRRGQPSWGSLFTLPPVMGLGCCCWLPALFYHVGRNTRPYILLWLSC